MGWLRRRGHLHERPLEDRSNEPEEPSAIDARAAIAMQRGTLARVKTDAGDVATRHAAESVKLRIAAKHEDFDVHAGVRIAAGDDMGRERLCRYGARPPMAIGRLRQLRDGRIAYRVSHARAGHAKNRVMTPIKFLARLAALVPPPRHPLVRYHGVLAPRSVWRHDVVPKPRAETTSSPERRTCSESSTARSDAPSVRPRAAPLPRPPELPRDSRRPLHSTVQRVRRRVAQRT